MPSVIDMFAIAPTCDSFPEEMTRDREATLISQHTTLQELRASIMAQSVVAEQRHVEILYRFKEQQQNIFCELKEFLMEAPLLRLQETKAHQPSSPLLQESSMTPPCVSASAGDGADPRERRVSFSSEPSGYASERNKAKVKSQLAKATKLLQASGSSLSLTSLIGVGFTTNLVKETRKKFRNIIRDDHFEICIATVILFSAILLCFEVQYSGLDVGFNLKYDGCDRTASAAWPSAESVFLIADWSIGVIYSLEAFVKIAALGCAYFRDSWNLLDLTCVVAFISNKCAATVTPVDGKALRLIRLIRLIHAVQVFRNLELFDSFFTMTTTIKGMKSIVFWAVTLLTIILMTIALMVSEILYATYFSKVDATTMTVVQIDNHHLMYEYFGTFTRCMFTMFELTLANYPKPARLLAEEVSEWFMLFMILHKLTLGFAVVGVLNAIVMQETFKVASSDDTIMVRQKERASRSIKKKLLTLFSALDTDKHGDISFTEFQIIADIPEVRLWLSSMGIETDDLPTLFALIDDDKSGRITVDEFVARVPRISGAAKGIDVLALDYKLQMSKVQLLAQIRETDVVSSRVLAEGSPRYCVQD